MSDFGSNVGYVDELYARFLANPESVSEAWRDFFADYRPATRLASAPAGGGFPKVDRRSAAGTPPPTAGPASASSATEGAQAMRGAAAKIVENMNASLAIPTATSVRTIPAKLLDENRRLINQYQEVTSRPKISFTHVIAWGIVRALEKHATLNDRFVEIDKVPHRVSRKEIQLGLAVDIERKGERALVVPNIKNAGALDFQAFVAAYEDRIQRARRGGLSVEDLKDTTVTLTNPGTLGTVLSVPRLMAGQGVIVGTGSIGYPTEYAGMAPEVISALGIAKTMTITSTYDHRIVQGAESGAFLATLEKLLLGQDEFYERIFRELGVPHEPAQWGADSNPQVLGASGNAEAIAKQARVLQLVRAYRVRGHLWADLDPLGSEPKAQPELELSYYGLSVWDLDRTFYAGGLAGNDDKTMTLRAILDVLRRTYCRHVGVEYMHIQDHATRAWLQERMESTRTSEALSKEAQLRILASLNAAEAFEKFLHTSYVGQKRFSLEGAETLIPMLDAMLNDASALGIDDAVIGMSHRGRLNVLTNVLGVSYAQVFREFEGDQNPDSAHGSGDVKYHIGATGSRSFPHGGTVRLSVAPNPSHLEAVDPVVEGTVRARQDARGDLIREKVLPILIHGDAAFSGQGVVAETLNLSQLKGYRTGGTIHIVVNNQIGFTTGPADLRSSPYATDVARMVQAPVFHVNGDHPEDAVRVMRLAIAFRQAFKRDVVVDLLCYRRWGHNEGDDPSYTHPLLYAKIETHRSPRKIYTEQLMRRGDLDMNEAEASLQEYRALLQRAHDEVREAKESKAAFVAEDCEAQRGLASGSSATAAPRERLEQVLDGLDRLPEGFQPHPKLVGQLRKRRQKFEAGTIDWALAEALAFGSLALEGTRVRLSGEDSGRGTFSQRHSTLFDYATGEPYVPLAHLAQDQAPYNAYDSLLSEFAVLGFEFGYSVESAKTLVMWEAQFGDFVNGAQVILDQFLSCSEEKWRQTCGLTLLLPHGFEGQGPEHSSSRVERFLQQCAQGNMQVSCPSTPAQYFHLLRRQATLSHRKPLVVLTPKSLLRHPEAVSAAGELTSGAFREVLDDPAGPAPAGTRRLVLCYGKLYWEMVALRRELGVRDVALARVEQFYPFPQAALTELLARYERADEWVWAQEEPRNMGAFNFMEERLRPLLRPARQIFYAGRPRSSATATGSHKRHLAEQQALAREALLGGAGNDKAATPAANGVRVVDAAR